MDNRRTCLPAAAVAGFLLATPSAASETAPASGVGLGLVLFVLFAALIILLQFVPGLLLFLSMLRSACAYKYPTPAAESDLNDSDGL
jgi:hypothetical protein